MLVRYLIRRNRNQNNNHLNTYTCINIHYNIILVITDDQKSGICDALKAKISSLEKDNIELREKVTQLMAQNKGILENFVTRFDVRIKGFKFRNVTLQKLMSFLSHFR